MAEGERTAADTKNDGRMIMKDIIYVHEPDDLQCGQAVLAMITGKDVLDTANELDNHRETKLSEMRAFLSGNGYYLSDSRMEARTKDDLPPLALLSLETPRCWHWSLYAYGTFYDPEHGVMTDFPECKRKYYWEVHEDEKR